MKKFISLFLVFSILALSGNLLAKERKGADLIIQKTDGQQVRGELIAVKENSLLLLERESGADVMVSIRDVNVITMVKKSKLWKGAGIGFFVGGIAGAVFGAANADADKLDLPTGHAMLLVGGIGGALGLLVGGGIGATFGKDETIQIERKSDSEIKGILEDLRKKARVPNFQ